MKVVVFVEEESMKVTLDHLLPKIGVDAGMFQILPHQGVQDLERSLRNKLPNWNEPNVRFLIIRDNDGGDCTARKARLEEIADTAGKSESTIVRIVCQELEAWFLGDPEALEAAGYLNVGSRPTAVRGDPDQKTNASERLDRLSKNTHGKVSRAADISPHLNPENNNSASFNHTVASLRHLADGNGE